MTRYYCIPGEETLPRLAERRDGRYVSAETPERLRPLEGVDFASGPAGRDLGAVERTAPALPTSPSKIVCVGRNYREHARELDNPVPEEPLIFLKPPSALIPDGGSIRLPPQSEEVHHEAELACIIGTRATELSEEEAGGAVAAYTCANDVTARDLQRADKTFTRGKGFDSFCPVGPGFVPGDAFEPSDREISCRVDGATRQSATFDDLIFSIPHLISYVSDIMTLLPGDLLLTGTPPGVGPIEPGVEVEVEVEGIGTLRNPVVHR